MIWLVRAPGRFLSAGRLTRHQGGGAGEAAAPTQPRKVTSTDFYLARARVFPPGDQTIAGRRAEAEEQALRGRFRARAGNSDGDGGGDEDDNDDATGGGGGGGGAAPARPNGANDHEAMMNMILHNIAVMQQQQQQQQQQQSPQRRGPPRQRQPPPFRPGAAGSGSSKT